MKSIFAGIGLFLLAIAYVTTCILLFAYALYIAFVIVTVLGVVPAGIAVTYGIMFVYTGVDELR